MTETRIHPVTGKTLRREVRPETISHGAMARTVDLPGWYPDDDSDSIHSGTDLEARDEAFRELRAAYAARIRSVRKRHKLTQEEAGRLIGGGPRAFQKYESGKTPPSEAAVGLIEILDRHPEVIATLREVRKVREAGMAE